MRIHRWIRINSLKRKRSISLKHSIKKFKTIVNSNLFLPIQNGIRFPVIYNESFFKILKKNIITKQSDIASLPHVIYNLSIKVIRSFLKRLKTKLKTTYFREFKLNLSDLLSSKNSKVQNFVKNDQKSQKSFCSRKFVHWKYSYTISWLSKFRSSWKTICLGFVVALLRFDNSS